MRHVYSLASSVFSRRLLPAVVAAAAATTFFAVGTARADHQGGITQWVNQFGAGDGQWSNPANWNNHGPPSSTTDPRFAFINVEGSGPATVGTAGQSVVETYVGQGAGDGALVITTGGELTNTVNLYVAQDSGRSGSYTQDGGAMNVGGSFFLGNTGGTGTASVTGGTLTTTGSVRLSDLDAGSTANSSFSITGGTLNTGGLLTVGVRSGGTGTGRGSFEVGGDAIVNIGSNVAMRAGTGNSFSVNGSSADINVNRPFTNSNTGITGFEVSQGNDVNFTFDAGGISPVDIAATMRWSHADTTLNVDASAFAAPGSFPLFTFGDYFGGNSIRSFGTENLTFAPGFTGDVSYNPNSITLEIIPEPASLGLLVMGSLLGLRRRRA